MTNTKQLIDEACLIISNNLGQEIAGKYKKYYDNKNEKTILMSINQLLTELVGAENAQKQLQELSQKLNIKKYA